MVSFALGPLNVEYWRNRISDSLTDIFTFSSPAVHEQSLFVASWLSVSFQAYPSHLRAMHQLLAWKLMAAFTNAKKAVVGR